MRLFRIRSESLPQILEVTVKTPEETLFEGKASAISSVNNQGIFDVIPYHTNIITIIRDRLIIHIGGETKSIDVQQGIIKVMSNTIHIYLGIKTVV